MALVLPLEIYSTFNGESFKSMDDGANGVLCRAQVGIRSINMFVSVFILTYLAFDRYLTVVQSKTARIFRKTVEFSHSQISIVAVIWCAGILIAIEPIRRAKTSAYGTCGIDWGDTEECYVTVQNGTGFIEKQTKIPLRNVGFCACDMSRSHKIFQVVAFVCSFLCPLIIILSSYFSIVNEVRKTEKNAYRPQIDNQRFLDLQFQSVDSLNAKKSAGVKWKKTIRVSLICLSLILGFVCCWTPYHLNYIILIFFNDSAWTIRTCSSFNKIYNFLIWSMRITNPLLYCFLQMMLKDNSIAQTRRKISTAFRKAAACTETSGETPVTLENKAVDSQ
ncbi:Oidioi.mRNA.OKI2018_I69.chr1.g2557.t1.cds [Oikopleura dioica]|uniref:Oidioi.mRNA.OKI2018_I69.chr1.g2557.t1.cds n=1 Tax=Oikopleura dioica TaxID=34765 RepID=A0ABN7ST79_OIKDI|nr:Oidioi.mRNA.OKI2018_I69.chr1.g2557.t1.cds [Oikopleura dioica]